MATASPFIVALLLVGVVLAALYGVLAAAQLIRVTRVAPLGNRQDQTIPEATVEVPTRRFKGEAFESSWQGSRGYDRPPDPRGNQNWTDRVFVSVITPLRPSRYGDNSYWTRYLPGVAALFVVLFIGLPILLTVILQPTTGVIAAFTPTPAQRGIPGRGAYVGTPSACGGGAPRTATSSSSAARVDFNSDGTVVGVHPGGRVVVRYLYGKPVFSPGTPLCPVGAQPAAGTIEFAAADSGSGFVYLPQPTGTVVAEIRIRSSDAGMLALVAGIALTILVVDVLLTILTRRSMLKRYS